MNGADEHRGKVNAEIENLKFETTRLRTGLDKQEEVTAAQRLEFEGRLTGLERGLKHVEDDFKKVQLQKFASDPLLSVLGVSVVVYILFGKEPAMNLIMGLFK